MALSLSIVIPSHNRADLLRLCLPACRATPRPARKFSSWTTPRRRHVARTAAGLSRRAASGCDRRGGFCVAANAGIRAAHVTDRRTAQRRRRGRGRLGRRRPGAVSPTRRVAAVAPLVLLRRAGPAGARRASTAPATAISSAASPASAATGGPLATATFGRSRLRRQRLRSVLPAAALLDVGAFPEPSAPISRMWTCPFGCTGPASSRLRAGLPGLASCRRLLWPAAPTVAGAAIRNEERVFAQCPHWAAAEGVTLAHAYLAGQGLATLP